MKKYQVKKRQFFTKTQESRFKFYLKFILKLLAFNWAYYKSTTKILKNWNNKSKEYVCLKLTSQYGVQTYFFIKKFNEIYMYEVIA
jgi:hypothetical protein